MMVIKRVGFLQFSPVLGDLPANIKKIEELFKQCDNSDLIILPELSNSGYNFESLDQAWETAEQIKTSMYIEFLVEACRKYNMAVVSGFNERDKDLLYNSSVLVGGEGVIGVYRKIHLFMNEKDYFTPGNSKPETYDLGGWRVGMLICFDWIFPEVWRLHMINGADLVAHPSNLVIPGKAQRAVPVQAMMNRFYVVTANRYGTEGDLTFTGNSVIADPMGSIIGEAQAGRDAVVVVEMDTDFSRNKMMTPRNNIMADRRPEMYDGLIKKAR